MNPETPSVSMPSGWVVSGLFLKPKLSILNRCKQALNQGGSIYILEAFWDRQRFEGSAFTLQQTSLYFTAMANGNSQMYDSRVFVKCVAEAGLQVVEEIDSIGVSHTLFACKPITK
jgi:hypothetical protein